eukprot:gnl/MRDRNA2_/MRDRNA2_84111_c0_seq1.p1 gnl/MRDRNA2_/MRDRNA2_84111_c0~~gnl/MRDRNA2_/MRDRNA2_84111_c0_seq1.p1  ORF type:complete len:934 (+),score=214.51 gnl/MRDRNA2_/MRDRNA2_84111_c0_seq1:127-2928(+)
MPVFVLDPEKPLVSATYASVLFGGAPRKRQSRRSMSEVSLQRASISQNHSPRSRPKLPPTLSKGATTKCDHSPAHWHGSRARMEARLEDLVKYDFFPVLHELPSLRVRKKRPPALLPPLDSQITKVPQSPEIRGGASQPELVALNAAMKDPKEAEPSESEGMSSAIPRRCALLEAEGTANLQRGKVVKSPRSDGSGERANSASSSTEGESSAAKITLTHADTSIPQAPLYQDDEGMSAEDLVNQGWPAFFVRAWFKVENASGYAKAEALPLFHTFSAFCESTQILEMHKDDLASSVQAMGYLLCNVKAIQKISDDITQYSTLNFEQFLKFNKIYSNYERAEWKSHFDRHDLDGSGCISMHELKAVIAELGYTPMREMLHEALHEVDKDKSKSIDLDEFIRLMDIYRRTEGFTKSDYVELEEIFKRFDRDADKKLSQEEVAILKKYLDMKGSEELQSDQAGTSKASHFDWRGFLAEMRRCREAEIQFFRKQFDKYDEDGSGTLSTAELPRLLENAGYIPLRKALNEATSIVDHDQSGEIDFDEFLELMTIYRRSEGFSKSEIEEQKAIFKKFDVDEIDEISVMELGGILKEQGYLPDLVKLQNLCDDYDIDGSGDIGFREYLKIIRRFREKELAHLKRLFWRFDRDGSGSMATEEIASLLLELGHEVSMPVVAEAVASVDEDRSGEVDWEEFVRLMDNYRDITVKQERRKCGFNDQELEMYQEIFSSYDIDGSDNIEPKELMAVLSDLNMQPRSRTEQQKLVSLLAECRERAEEKDEMKITFWVFLQLMRTLEDDKSRDSLAVERKAAAEAKFSKEEVREFREIFFFWVDDLAQTGDGSGVASGIRALSSDGVAKMLRSLGLSFTPEDRHTLGNLCIQCDHDGNGAVDFPDYLVLMSKLLQLNFAGIKDVTGGTSSRRPSALTRAGSKRSSTSK